MSMMVSFVLSFFPRDVLDEILNLIESVSEDFPSYSCIDAGSRSREVARRFRTSHKTINRIVQRYSLGSPQGLKIVMSPTLSPGTALRLDQKFEADSMLPGVQEPALSL